MTEDEGAWYREKQWLYIGPILGAPLAHIGVTLFKKANPMQKRLLAGFIAVSTISTVVTRVYLMDHAMMGGGGFNDSSKEAKARIKPATQ